MPEKIEQFRFQNGSLYEYSKESNAYIHCYRRAGLRNKQQAISEYREACEHEEVEESLRQY